MCKCSSTKDCMYTDECIHGKSHTEQECEDGDVFCQQKNIWRITCETLEENIMNKSW